MAYFDLPDEEREDKVLTGVVLALLLAPLVMLGLLVWYGWWCATP